MPADDAANRDDPFLTASLALKTALIVRFLLELALLAGVAALAWQLTPGGWRWAAAAVGVVSVAALWGLLLSPKAPVGLPLPATLTIEGVLFLGTATGLLLVGLAVPAVVGVAVWIVDRAALLRLRDDAPLMLVGAHEESAQPHLSHGSHPRGSEARPANAAGRSAGEARSG